MGQRFREKDISVATMNSAIRCLWAQKNIPRYIGRTGHTTNKPWFWLKGIEYTPITRRERHFHGL